LSEQYTQSCIFDRMSELRQKKGGGSKMINKALLSTLALILLAATLFPGDSLARYASVVMDSRTGQVIYSRNADKKLYPASLTKIMTLYMTFEALDRGQLRFDQMLSVSKRAEGQAPTKLGLKRGGRISVRDAVFGLITKSANDAATVLAEAMAPTEAAFARKMTEKARKLGMQRTSFRNASGLPNRRQKSTARDMAILGAAMIHDFPHYYNYLSLQKFDYKGKAYKNHNNLLGKYKGADGIKTGYIRASGFNLVASAKRGRNRLIGVVFGGRSAKSRDRHMKKLLDKGFTKIETIYPTTIPTPTTRPLRIALGTSHQSKPAVQIARSNIDTPGTVAAIKKTAIGEGSWGIQVGAFSRADKARSQLNKANRLSNGLLDNGQFNIQRVTQNGTAIYRAQMVGFNEQGARNLCKALERKSMTCFVVSAGTGNLVRVADRN
jgi:D-alanyl-D-alanine carboxypeptidase